MGCQIVVQNIVLGNSLRETNINDDVTILNMKDQCLEYSDDPVLLTKSKK